MLVVPQSFEVVVACCFQQQLGLQIIITHKTVGENSNIGSKGNHKTMLEK
jgi:hypothetical protein